MLISDMRHRSLLAVGFVIAVLVTFGTIYALIVLHQVQHNQNRIAVNQVRIVLNARADKVRQATNDRQVRQAAFRICERGNVVRALLQIQVGLDQNQLPILDCSPNLTDGGEALRLSHVAAQAYVLAYQRGCIDQLTGLPKVPC